MALNVARGLFSSRPNARAVSSSRMLVMICAGVFTLLILQAARSCAMMAFVTPPSRLHLHGMARTSSRGMRLQSRDGHNGGLALAGVGVASVAASVPALRAATVPSASEKGKEASSESAAGVPPAELEEIRSEREKAMSRVEELEIVADARDAKLKAAEERADKKEQEKQAALARVQELEAKLQAVQARAEGLQSLLATIGSTVGSALKNADVVEGDLSLYDAAVKESQNSKKRIQQVEFEKDQTLERAVYLEQKLTVSEERMQALGEAEVRAQKLAEGVKQIYEKVGADSRGGLFSSLFRRTDDDMIKDTLAQIDDLREQ